MMSFVPHDFEPTEKINYSSSIFFSTLTGTSILILSSHFPYNFPIKFISAKTCRCAKQNRGKQKISLRNQMARRKFMKGQSFPNSAIFLIIEFSIHKKIKWENLWPNWRKNSHLKFPQKRKIEFLWFSCWLNFLWRSN
jgi:hypothetical protein